GWSLFLTTPCGTNWFYDLFQAAGAAPGWARWQRPTSDNPRVPPAELEAAKAELGTYAFSQEFEAQFLQPRGGFFKEEWLRPRYEVLAAEQYQLDGGLTIAKDALRVFVTVDLATSVKTTA